MRVDLDAASASVRVGAWKRPAKWIEDGRKVHRNAGYQRPRALIALRRDLNLLVSPDSRGSRALVQLWSGEPDVSDGVAILGDARPRAVANIPLCSCGERGCGNVGVQFSVDVNASDVPRLVELIESLPNAHDTPTRETVWRGDT